MASEMSVPIAVQACVFYSGATLFSLILDRHPLIPCDGEAILYEQRQITG